MIKIFYYIQLCFIIVILFGCEQNTDFKGKGLPPKIVVNSIINAQTDTHLIKISESVFDFSDQKASVVENIEAHLYINGTECDNLSFYKIDDVHTYYKFISVLKKGDVVEFTVHTPKHGTVKGSDIVPENTAEIKDIEHSWFWLNGIQFLRLYVTIQDNIHKSNYYRIVIRTNTNILHPSMQEPNNIWDLQEVLTDDEILFNEPTESEEEGKNPHFYRIFTNNLFQGKEYKLNLFIRCEDYTIFSDNNYVRQNVKVEIQSLSEKLYRGLRSHELASGSIGDLYSEPVKIYTNMQGGYGILGIYTSTELERMIAEKGD